jgi:hypothetical protein
MDYLIQFQKIIEDQDGQQLQEVAELQLATQKLESNYKSLAENWSDLRKSMLASTFQEDVA